MQLACCCEGRMHTPLCYSTMLEPFVLMYRVFPLCTCSQLVFTAIDLLMTATSFQDCVRDHVQQTLTTCMNETNSHSLIQHTGWTDNHCYCTVYNLLHYLIITRIGICSIVQQKRDYVYITTTGRHVQRRCSLSRSKSCCQQHVSQVC